MSWTEKADHKQTILVVDDRKSDLERNVKKLQTAGYNVIYCLIQCEGQSKGLDLSTIDDWEQQPIKIEDPDDKEGLKSEFERLLTDGTIGKFDAVVTDGSIAMFRGYKELEDGTVEFFEGEKDYTFTGQDVVESIHRCIDAATPVIVTTGQVDEPGMEDWEKEKYYPSATTVIGKDDSQTPALLRTLKSALSTSMPDLPL